jgi:hypothetical protein
MPRKAKNQQVFDARNQKFNTLPVHVIKKRNKADNKNEI